MTLPNFPFLIYEWVTAFGASQGVPPNQHVDLSPRTLSAVSFKKGKQYELDTIQASELNLTLDNKDAVLDPTNTSGPYAGQIAPYQGFRIQAQWPVTKNLLPQAVASGGEGWSVGTIPHSGIGTQNFNMYSATDSTGVGSIVSPSDAAYSGTNAFQFNVPSGSAAGSWIGAYVAVSTVPGQSYSFQCRVRNVTAGTAINVYPVLGWFSPSSGSSPVTFTNGATFTLTGASTGAPWQLITVSGQAPVNACGVAVGFMVQTTTTAACNVQADVWQAEQASAATTYTYPGVWYPVFNGFVERWPTEWQDGGTYGKLAPTLTDVFGLMSMGELDDPLTEEINSNGPRFLYRFDDPASSNDQAFEANGKYQPLLVGSQGQGGTVVTGESITAASPSGTFTAGGVNPTVSRITPAGSNGNAFWDLESASILGPDPNQTAFTRTIAFRSNMTYAANTGAWLWCATDGANACGIGVQWTSSTTSEVAFYLGLGGVLNSSVHVLDGNWHFITFGYDSASSNWLLTVDGGNAATSTTATATGFDYSSDLIGYGLVNYANAPTNVPFSGDVAYAAEFPTLLTTSEIYQMYFAWRNACSGESSGARYQRILRYAGYGGSASINGTQTSQMGPATDLQGSDALTCLNNVVVTENGTHFVDSKGLINFQGRGYRYNPGTPKWTFGENTSAGEYPYEDLKLDFDTTHLANDVTVTQNSTGQQFYGLSTTAQSAFFDRTMSRTINVLNASEAQDCANFLVYRYNQPLTRIVSLVLNPGAQASLWPVALTLEIGQLIQVNRRPFGCPEISLQMWIEQIQWDFDDKGNAKVTLQCSPTMPLTQGQFTTWRTTLYSAASSGQPTITVAPPTQDTVNPLDAYISPGMQLIVGWSGSVPETMTVKSVQSTGTNWTSGTITFTANLAHSHTAGFYVTENIPSSQTSLSAYDSNSKFDDVVFTY